MKTMNRVKWVQLKAIKLESSAAVIFYIFYFSASALIIDFFYFPSFDNL